MTLQVEKSSPDLAYQRLFQDDLNLDEPIEAEPLVLGRHRCDQRLPRYIIYGFCAVIFLLTVSNLVFLGELLRLRSLLHSLNPQIIFCES